MQAPWISSQQREMDHLHVEWDKGLPQDVLALVAKAGGVEVMKSMRGVCKTWQLGFELAVQGITINSPDHPTLPSGVEFGQRFSGLTKLDIGHSAAETALLWLENLRVFPRLVGLCLGEHNGIHYAGPRSLAWGIADSDMAHTQASSPP